MQGNYIGTDADGAVAIGNAGDGVHVGPMAAGILIGGTTAGARNVISGNGGNGVTIVGRVSIFSGSNVVQGNYIGTDATGAVAVNFGNTGDGVHVGEYTERSLIGGATPGARNVISGNGGHGVQITGPSATRVRVQGNRIGLPATGAAAPGNTVDGVRITGDSGNNLVGGAEPGMGNVIAHNGGIGVAVESGTNNAVVGNRIFENGGLGIDLLADGVTPNDLGDPDPGPNNLLNFPELTFARITATGLRINGSINTQSDRTQRIEFFASPSGDPSGHGEGARYLGFILLEMAVSNTPDFTALLPVGVAQVGWVVTATATDQLGKSSEFSAAQTVI
jgi:titin